MIKRKTLAKLRFFIAACFVASLIALLANLVYFQPATSQEAPFDWRSDWAVEKGFYIDIDTEGYHFPSALAFVPHPRPDPKAPLYFVTELRGTVKVVTNDRTIYTFAEDFAPKFTPKEELPSGYGQGGLAGICLDPKHGYIFVTFIYQDAHQILRNSMIRFQSEPETFSLKPTAQIDFTEAFLPYEAGLAHQIGPCQVKDDTVYVSVGEGWQPSKTQKLDFMHGKLIRMTLDGKPVSDNPFYEDDDIKKARNYVWAFGLRNPFGLKVIEDRVFVADNGPGVDRFLEIHKGENYLYDGSDASIAMNAAFVLVPAQGPVQMDYYPEGSTIFPAEHRRKFYLALAGAATGAEAPGIMTFEYGFKENKLVSVPKRFLAYRGDPNELQMVTGLTFGPDGLYFTPLFPNREGRTFVLKVTHDPERGSPVTLAQNSNPRMLMTEKGCTGCHTLDNGGGYGGTAGPDLTREALIERLQIRLNSEAYEKSLVEMDRIDNEPQYSYKQARQEVLTATGLDRVRVWIKYRIQEPRFDNLYSQMPNLGLSGQEAAMIADYLLTGGNPSGLSALLPRPVKYRHVLLAFGVGFLLGGLALAIGQWGRHRFSRTAVKDSETGSQRVGELSN